MTYNLKSCLTSEILFRGITILPNCNNHDCKYTLTKHKAVIKRVVLKNKVTAAFVHCHSCGAYVCKKGSCFFGHSLDNINCTRCYQNAVDESPVTRRTSPRHIIRRQRTLSQSPPARNTERKRKASASTSAQDHAARKRKSSCKFCKDNEHTLPTSKPHNFFLTKIRFL